MERNSTHCDTAGDGETTTLVLGHCRKRSETPASPTEQPRPSSTNTSPGRRRNRSRKLVPAVEGDKVIAERFRTKLCRNYLQHPDRPCPYEDRCMFAHGEHELRTAAQNVADGLMSEEAIREFKQEEGVRSTSLSRSSSMSSASAVHLISRLVVPSPHTLLNREGLPPSSHSDLFWGSQSSQDDGSGAEYLNLPPYHDAIVTGKKTEPTLRVYTQSPSYGSHSSSVASSLPATSDRRPSVSENPQHGSTFPQPCFNNPDTVPEAESTSAIRNFAGAHTYTHDPYSWRAV